MCLQLIVAQDGGGAVVPVVVSVLVKQRPVEIFVIGDELPKFKKVFSVCR